jgi:hypothetical protein
MDTAFDQMSAEAISHELHNMAQPLTSLHGLLFTSGGGELQLNQTPGIIVVSLPAAAPRQLADDDRERMATHV